MKTISQDWCNFKGKKILITGASKGLGRICANVLAGKGAKLVCSGRNKEKLEDLSEVMSEASICGLGQAASNPLKSVIKYFGNEITYE